MASRLKIPSAGRADEQIACTVPAAQKKTVVVISADHMGEGDEELGRILIKGFIFALTQQEHLPSTILFYNGGARLTCEDSASLEDLKNLASLGVEILTCGTCLNHYGLTDKLAVGDVTNMYVITEKQMRPTSFCARDAAQTTVCGSSRSRPPSRHSRQKPCSRSAVCPDA